MKISVKINAILCLYSIEYLGSVEEHLEEFGNRIALQINSFNEKSNSILNILSNIYIKMPIFIPFTLLGVTKRAF